MDRAASTPSFSVHLTIDAQHRFLHLHVERCVLRIKEEVATYFAHCYARIRTFELPSDMIVRYDHFEVSGDAVREFALRRGPWAESIGGALYRYSAANRSREMLTLSSLPGRTAFVVFESYDAAVVQLLADRSRLPRRQSFATLQRRFDPTRSARR